MLHIEYNKEEEYKGSKINIQPESREEMKRLKFLLSGFVVENPAKTFVEKQNSGGYEGYSKEEIEAEKEMACILSELWDGKPQMNVLLLLSRAMQMIINLK